MKFETYKLSDVCSYVKERIAIEEITLENYVSTENLLSEKNGKIKASSLPKAKTVVNYNKGDVLISNIRPYFKKIWFSDISGGSSSDVLVFRGNDKVNQGFLYYFLSQNVVFDYMVQTSKGTKMPRGDKEALMRYPIILPSLKYQEEISNLLSTIDNKIELNNSIISNLEEIAQTLFKRWFVDFEFPNEDGKPYKLSGGKMVESELGMIPEGWEVYGIRDLCDTNSENLSKKDNWDYINYLDTSNLTKNIIDNVKYIETAKEKVPSRAKRKVQRNDILYSTVRPNQHHYGIIKKPLDNMIVSTGFAVLRNNSKYPNDLIYLWLTQEEVTNSLQAIAEQSTSAYPSINVKDILLKKVAFPHFSDIQEFNEIIAKQNEIIWEKQLENKKLADLRDTLLPKLLSGEIEIPDNMEVTTDVPIPRG